MDTDIRTAYTSAVDLYRAARGPAGQKATGEDDRRRMSDREWDKLVEYIDKFLDAARDELDKKKELADEAAQKAAAKAPADMRAIMAAQAALKAAGNGIICETYNAWTRKRDLVTASAELACYDETEILQRKEVEQ